MPTPEEISAAHAEFQEKIAVLSTATSEYEAAKAPYLEKKAALVAAIQAVDEADNRLEALTTEYEPPTPPGAE